MEDLPGLRGEDNVVECPWVLLVPNLDNSELEWWRAGLMGTVVMERESGVAFIGGLVFVTPDKAIHARYVQNPFDPEGTYHLFVGCTHADWPETISPSQLVCLN